MHPPARFVLQRWQQAAEPGRPGRWVDQTASLVRHQAGVRLRPKPKA